MQTEYISLLRGICGEIGRCYSTTCKAQNYCRIGHRVEIVDDTTQIVDSEEHYQYPSVHI